MKIVRSTLTRMTLTEFADKYGLTMEVHERSPETCRVMDIPKFYACFADVEVSRNGCLVGEVGNGDTESAAIRNYGRRISEKRLVVYATTGLRKEITAPVLVEDEVKL